MNGREGYITTEITQRKKERKKEEEGSEKGQRLLGCERSWEFLSSHEGSFLPGTLGRSILCIFHPQNKSSPHQSPTFGPILYKFIVIGPVQKPRPQSIQYKKQPILFNSNLTITPPHTLSLHDALPIYSVCFSPPKQAVASSDPNFWTHSLQIHCNGPGLKTVTLQQVFENTKQKLLPNIT